MSFLEQCSFVRSACFARVLPVGLSPVSLPSRMRSSRQRTSQRSDLTTTSWMTGEDGKPLELGRFAMGVTYKVFDINLRCPVTLKVISERYLGDESAGLRFLHEARAAASVRHTNVDSVLHIETTT